MPQPQRGSATTSRIEIIRKVDPVDGSKTSVVPAGVNQSIPDVTPGLFLNDEREERGMETKAKLCWYKAISHLLQSARFTWLFLSCDLGTKHAVLLLTTVREHTLDVFRRTALAVGSSSVRHPPLTSTVGGVRERQRHSRAFFFPSLQIVLTSRCHHLVVPTFFSFPFGPSANKAASLNSPVVAFLPPSFLLGVAAFMIRGLVIVDWCDR